MKKHKTTSIIFNKIKQHIYENINLYKIVSIFFLIGIIGGVMFSNNIKSELQEPINSYISNFAEEIKSGYQVDYNVLIKQILLNHALFVLLIWFMGCTVIGIPIVYTIVAWKGFSLSYTIASIISTFGTENGIIICLLGLFLQNIITIPVILALAVSGNKLYKSIIKDKRRENIKILIIRHTLFSLSMFAMLTISAFIETYISSNLIVIYMTQFVNI